MKARQATHTPEHQILVFLSVNRLAAEDDPPGDINCVPRFFWFWCFIVVMMCGLKFIARILLLP